MSSGDLWCTPDDLYQVLDAEFNFEFDLCASSENTKCQRWTNDIEAYTKKARSFKDLPVDSQDPMGFLDHSYWMNPPYSRGNLEKCLKAAMELVANGATVVALLPDDASTKWYQTYVQDKANQIRRLNRRVKFVGAKNCSPGGNCVAVYDKRFTDPDRTISWGWK